MNSFHAIKMCGLYVGGSLSCVFVLDAFHEPIYQMALSSNSSVGCVQPRNECVHMTELHGGTTEPFPPLDDKKSAVFVFLHVQIP